MKRGSVQIRCTDLKDGIRQALNILGSREEDLDIQVVDAKAGFLGLGKREMIINASIKPASRASVLERELDRLLEDVGQQIGDTNGFFTVTPQADGYYLAVFAPTGKGRPVALSEVIKQLSTLGVQSDLDKVELAVSEATGYAVKVADSSRAAEGPCNVVITFSRDNQEAFATAEGPRLPTTKEIQDALAASGVIYKLDWDAIENLSKSGPLGHPTVVARGLLPIRGADGHIDYHFNTDKALKQIPSRGIGHLFTLADAPYFSKGALLATKVPPTPGTPGMTVIGEIIPSSPGDDQAIMPGTNTVLSDNGFQLAAATDGCVALIEGVIHIIPVLKISGDADFNTGHVNYDGNVVIEGNLVKGISVQATGAVVIGKTIQGGSVKAKGHLVVVKGILGAESASVHSDSDIMTSFIENALVSCGGNVIVSKEIMHSTVIARGEILVNSESGVIVGGAVRAGGRIGAQKIGSVFGTQTTVEAGISFEAFQRISELEGRLAVTNSFLGKTKEALLVLEQLKKEKGTLQPKHEAARTRLTVTMSKIQGEIGQISDSLENARNNISWVPSGQVEAWGAAYPGIRGIISGSPFEITTLQENVRIRNVSGQIKMDHLGQSIIRAPLNQSK